MSNTVRGRFAGATRGKLFILIVTNFVDMVGLLMILPLLPYYADQLGGGGMEIALLFSSFTAAQLISAPMWGRFSDKHGRKPALLVGLTAAAIAYIVFAFATSLWLLLLSRIVQGAGGGTVGVIQAYVADSTEPENRAKALGWLSAATNLGVALGPPLGSLALLFGRPGPGLVAAAMCVLNITFASRFLKESRDMTEASVKKPGASRHAIMRVVTHSGEPAPRLIWIYAIAMGAFSGMTAILALFLLDEWAVGPDRIWMVFTYLGVISVITRAGILGTLVDKLGEVRLSRIGLVLLAIGLGSIPFARHYVVLALAIALVPLGTAFTFPCVTSLLSRLIPSNERGLYMGVQQTFGGLARVIVPLWAGFAYDALGHAVPFYTSALLIGGTIFLGFGIDAGGGKKVATASPAIEPAA